MRKLCLLAIILLTTYAQAETFKWKDKDGNVQYGSNPPPGTKTEPVSTRAGRDYREATKGIIAVTDIDALPYLAKSPVNGRKAYEKYLVAPPAKLFVACSNGQFLLITKAASTYEALYKHMQETQGYNASLCRPYAFNDDVVWNRKK